MTVEDRRGGMDQFPVGMRVLVVDDDPVCLRMLEVLLQRCQYDVTTTSQAITALKMLRENRDRFDLVISDVQMPDMDGFKLLELVGLEMDLPVIMMSGNGDTQNVMKGIAHGACDYLIKPVRMEELKNIWQHVIRRKKFDNKRQHIVAEGDEGKKGKNVNCGSDHGATDNENLNKKRKEQDEEEGEGEDDSQGIEDNGTQKRPRVVWTIDLHRKFVNAVNQLGVDKAVPKKILDHMKVDNLTRENVASHLQKYRLYLKRLSAVTSQGGMTTAAGSRSTYTNLSALSGYRNYNALGGSRQVPALSSLQSHGILGKMSNNLPSLGKHGSLPSQAAQFGDILRNATSSFSDFRKLEGINLSGNHQGTLLPRVPTTLELNRLQQSKAVQEVKCQMPPSLSGDGVAYGLSRGVSDNPLMFRPDKLLDQFGGLSNISLARMSSSGPSKTETEVFLQLSNLIKHDNTWPRTVGSTDVSTNPLSMLGHLSSSHFPSRNSINSLSSVTLNDHNSLLGNSLSGMASAPQQNPMMSNQCLDGSRLALAKGVYDKDHFSNLTILEGTKQKWDETFDPDHISRTSSSSSFPDVSVTDPAAEYQISESDLLIGQESFSTMAFLENCAVDDSQLNYRDQFPFECSRWKSELSTSDCSLDDLVNSMIKQEQDDAKQKDVYLGSDMHNQDEESKRGSGDGKTS